MTQVEELKHRLDTVRQQHLQKEEECTNLSAHWAEAKKKIVDLQHSHKLVIEEQQENSSQSIKKLQREIETLKEGHQVQLAELEQKQKNELSRVKDLLSNEQSSMLESEAKKYEEQQKMLEVDFAKKEMALQQRVSQLSLELCQVKDQLALVEQKGRELEGELGEDRKIKEEFKKRLTEKEEETMRLGEEVTTAQLELSIAQEKYAQQKESLMKMSG